MVMIQVNWIWRKLLTTYVDSLYYICRAVWFWGEWRRWISFCISAVHFLILVGISSCGLFGDPFSSFCDCYGSKNVVKGRRVIWLVPSWNVDNDSLIISHVLFVDYSLMFLSISKPASLLEMFSLFWGFFGTKGYKSKIVWWCGGHRGFSGYFLLVDIFL